MNILYIIFFAFLLEIGIGRLDGKKGVVGSLDAGLSADHHFMTWELGLLKGDRLGLLRARDTESYKWEPIWK